jgi:hypothetical protein
MLAPEINWYFDGTVQEQVKDDDTGVTAVRRGLGAADLRQTAAASGGNIPRGKLLVGLVEIETPNPGSGLNSARSNSRKTMPMEAPPTQWIVSFFSMSSRKRTGLAAPVHCLCSGGSEPVFCRAR